MLLQEMVCVPEWIDAHLCIRVPLSPSNLHLDNNLAISPLLLLQALLLLIQVLFLLQALPVPNAGVYTSPHLAPTQANALGVKKKDI